MSDMNLSAWVTLGRVSFHLSCASVMQIEKEDPYLNLTFTPTCISTQFCLILSFKRRRWRTVRQDGKVDTEEEKRRD